MFHLILLCLGSFFQLFRRRADLAMENLVLRQQLAVLKRRRQRPHLRVIDKIFWVAAFRFWPKWKQSLIVVTPETVVRWHRAGFRRYCVSFRGHGDPRAGSRLPGRFAS